MNIPLWLAGFIAYQGHGKHPVRPEQDDQSCITLLTKGRSTAETHRFIEVRQFWISDYIRIGTVNIVYVLTEDMTSDHYTKPLQGTVFSKMVKKILGNLALLETDRSRNSWNFCEWDFGSSRNFSCVMMLLPFGTLITGNYKKGRKKNFERKKTILENQELYK